MALRELPGGTRVAGSALVLAAMALLSTACGTRVDRASAAGSAGATAAYSAPTAQDAGAGAGSTTVPAAQATIGGAASAASGTSSGATPGVGSSAPSHTGTANRPTTAAPVSSATGSSTPGPGGPTPGSPAVGASGAPAIPGGAGPTDPGRKSPLVIATLCNCSGPPSSAALPIVQGGQIWVKQINDRGGLNGHPVRQVLYDDGSDPARARSQAQEAIEREHAVAFFTEAAPLSAKGSVEYITTKGIPVVGTSLSNAWDYESPMYFPQASGDRPATYGAIAGAAQQLVPAGKTKLALVYCAEAEQCAHIEKNWVEFAKQVGFQVVYESPVSLAQPDYTAVCLSARNAGAQVTAVLADVNSLTRIAASCARQGLKTAFTSMPQTVAERFKDDPNVETYATGVNVFPFFQSGTSATDEYQAAMSKQGGGKVVPGVGTATGWVAGKLLERVGAALPEPPTSQAILQGLWSLKNDDLGGLTQPLTFAQGQTAAKVACWFNITTKGGAWSSPDGYQRHCASGLVN